MDWALITWGVLIGMVALLWFMVVASVQDESTLSQSDGANDETRTADETAQSHERYERQTAA